MMFLLLEANGRRWAVGVVVVVCLWMLWGLSREMPTYEAVRATYRASEGVLLDRHGDILHEMRVTTQGRRLAWTPLALISPTALAVLVAAEDRRFWEHSGVDGRALAAAIWRRLTGGSRRGASTIAMQLAGLLQPQLANRKGGRSFVRKWAQMRGAWGLIQGWSRSEILEVYLNQVTFRGELVGIGAAARGLFDKGVGGLTRLEGVILAALLRNPNAREEILATRTCQLARRVTPELACGALRREISEVFTKGRWIRPLKADAPQLARRLLPLGRGVTIQTTLDGRLQQTVRAILAEQLSQLAGQNVRNAAVLVADNARGEVLAYVGNTPRAEADSQVDGIRALRQAGSTLKPFLYGLVVEKRLLTAASLLEDSPLDIVFPGGLYSPRNYEPDFKGWVSVRTALAASLNVPAVKVLLLAGLEPMVHRLRSLGFAAAVKSGAYYGPSLALGSVEVSLWQLVNAYRTLANGGMFAPLRLTQDEKLADPSRLLAADSTFIIKDILADPSARVITFGLDNALTLPFWSAVKTGTSKGMRDNWCVGLSRQWTVGVWVGNFSGEPMHDVSGVSGAAPVWRAVMESLGESGAEPVAPPGLVQTKTHFLTGEESDRWEWYLAGTEMERVERLRSWVGKGNIVYPKSGVIMALDPDIPRDRERVVFRMEPPQSGWHWRLDGRDLPQEEGWAPTVGQHRLELLDRHGEVMDRANFEVRGHSRE